MGGRAYTRLATALRILLRHYWVVTKLIDNLCINLQMSLYQEPTGSCLYVLLRSNLAIKLKTIS